MAKVTLEQTGKEKDAPYVGNCPPCISRNRRGGLVKIKAENSNDRHNWFVRHSKHA